MPNPVRGDLVGSAVVAQTNKWESVKSLDLSLDSSWAVLWSVYQVLKLIGFVFDFDRKQHLKIEIWKVSLSCLPLRNDFDFFSLGRISISLTIDVS